VKTPEKILPQLSKQSEYYDLIIPGTVQQKIDYLCNQIHEVEWSGTLFYTISGEFDSKENPLIVTVLDIFLQDIGSMAYTEFSRSPDLAGYMAYNPELLDENVFMGLIHSHNSMSTFFSGTDQNTLRQEGADQNHFVSLIVNNHKEYTAGITRKVITKQDIKEDYSYHSFFDRVVNASRNRVEEVEVIEWFYLDVIIEGNFDHAELKGRIKEIRTLKDRQSTFKNKTLFPNNSNSLITENYKIPAFKQKAFDFDFQDDFVDMSYKDSKKYQKQTEQDFEEPFEDTSIPYGVVRFDEDIIKKVVRQLVTGSVLTHASDDFDLESFVKKSEQLFQRRFETLSDYKMWAEGHVEFILTTTIDPNLWGYGEDAMLALCAFGVKEELKKLPCNIYTESLIDTVSLYIL